MAHKPREIEALLQSKFGFVPTKHRSDDHRYYQLLLRNLPPIITKVSHGKKDIGSKLASKIARQLRVRGPFFTAMFDCTKSRGDYEQQVRHDPYPPWEHVV